MSYESSLEAAGAKIIEFERFGSYQGDWWAKIECNGKSGWIQGTYGSSSSSDAFEAEFGFDDSRCSKHTYDNEPPDCPECEVAKKRYTEHLKDFGELYLDTLMTQAEAETAASENIEWDHNAQEMLDWIRTHSLNSQEVPSVQLNK